MILQNKKYSHLEDFSKSNLSQHTQLLLNFKWNKVDEEDALKLANSLRLCQQLVNLTLQLSLNKIGDNFISDLGFALIDCTHLSSLTLDLSSNEIYDEGISDLANALSNCPNLSNLALDLSYNKFSDKGISELGSALKNFKILSELILNLSLNKITANGSHDLWACLKICKHLRNLTINLKAKGANCAHGLNSDIINTNIMILKLDLRWNKIGKNGLKSLKQALKSCVNLASLELYLSKLNLNANEVVKVTRLVPKLNKLVFKQIIID